VTEETQEPGGGEAEAAQVAAPPIPRDLPKDAAHRLEELEHGLFTSDLSVNEFLLVKEAGFHPLGFVMGSSIYHIGLQTRKWSTSQELDKLTSAMYAAAVRDHRYDEDASPARCSGAAPANRERYSSSVCGPAPASRG